jgi:hypothetical protein
MQQETLQKFIETSRQHFDDEVNNKKDEGGSDVGNPD